MYIRKVMSFGGSWELLNKEYSTELNDINTAIHSITKETIEKTKLNKLFGGSSSKSMKLSQCFENAFDNVQWDLSTKYIESESTRKFHLNLLGPISNEVSIKLIRTREILNRWLFSISPIAYKNSIISLPIAVCLLEEADIELTGKRLFSMRSNFGYIMDELLALAPLSHTTPFIILGLSFEDGDLDLIELESESELAQQKIIIDRSIEFPAEYHQAGLGILNYFGTVIREKYPDQNAKVKIEQDGLQVRMIIETENGDKEVIEKALKEYEMVLRGEKPADELFESKLKVMELQTELRIAQVRLENARDLLALKTNETETLKSLFGHSLTSKTSDPIINVTVTPHIELSNTLNNTTIINDATTSIAQDLQELLYTSGITPDTEMQLMDLSQSIENISNENNKEKVKGSLALKKLKSFIDDAQNANNTLNKFISTASDGIDKIQSIGEKYNSIAEWCGAPTIPKIFLKDS